MRIGVCASLELSKSSNFSIFQLKSLIHCWQVTLFCKIFQGELQKKTITAKEVVIANWRKAKHSLGSLTNY